MLRSPLKLGRLLPCIASQMERKHGKCWTSPVFEGKLWVFISYLSEIKTISMFYNFLVLVLFTACFYHFLYWRFLNSSMTSFSSDILLPFLNSNDLNCLDHVSKITWFDCSKMARLLSVNSCGKFLCLYQASRRVSTWPLVFLSQNFKCFPAF